MFSNLKKLFNLAPAASLGTFDNLDGFDSIMKKVDNDVSKEFEVSLNERELVIIFNTHSRVVKQINEEIYIIEAIKVFMQC